MTAAARTASTGRFRGGVEFRILGALEVAADGRVVELSAAKVRALLGMLLLHPNRVISADRLCDGLWSDARPQSAVNTLQGYMSQLRKALGGHTIQTRSPGYLLAVDGDRIDAVRFERLLDEAQRARACGDPSRSATVLAQGLELWRGEALADFSYAEWAQAEIARLEELHLVAIEEWIDARLDLGQHNEVLGELEALVIAHPLRERLWAARMLALYRSGRQAEALRSYEDLREKLAEELGIDPSPALVALEHSVLRQEVTLEWRPPPAVLLGLPVARSTFVGRAEEVADLEKLVQESGLITIVGPGGIGKTRLALEVAHRASRHDTDVRLVELAALADPSLIVHEVATSCGVREEPGRAPMESLVAFLRPRQVLVVLDNCEHLLEPAARLADILLRAAPRLSILATSRQPLRIDGERVWTAPSLPVPPTDEMSPEAILEFDSARLFVARASDADRRFVLTAENAAAVSQICRRLDGVPLALELAAARTAFMALPELARRLDDRFTFLTGGSRTSAIRHQTLEAAIDWGYGLLESHEQMLFCRLSVFAGTFTLAAAEAVCQGEGVEPETVMHALAGLVEKSFVSADTQAEVTHYRILETLRAYGAKNLTATDDASAVQSRLLQWGISLAHEAEPHLKGEGQQAWIKVIDDNVDNLRSMLTWARAGANLNGALELVVALQRFWELRSVKEGRVWVETLLDAAGPDVPPALRMKALTVAGVLAAHEGDHLRVRSVYEDCLTVSRRFSLGEGVGKALLGLGHVAYMQGDYGAARRLCGESLELGRRLWELRTVAASLNVLGRVAHFQCRYGDAEAALQESLVVRRELGDREWIAVALGALGDLAYTKGDYGAGRAHCEESLQIAQDIGAPHQQAWALSVLSDLDLAEGNIVSAGAGLESSLQVFRELGDRSCTARTLSRLSRFEQARGDRGRSVSLLCEAMSLADANGERISVIECLEQLADALLHSDDQVGAAVLLGFADAQRAAMEAPLPNFQGSSREAIAARPDNGDRLSAWNSGRSMSFREAVEFALRISSEMRRAR